MKSLFNLKKGARQEGAIPEASSSQQYLLLRSSTQSSEVDSQSGSIHDPFSDSHRVGTFEANSTGSPLTTTANNLAPSKTLFISSRGYGKKVFFTTTAFPNSEADDVVGYIENPNNNTSSARRWGATLYGAHPDQTPPIAGSGEEIAVPQSVLLARITRSSYWRQMAIELLNADQESGAVSIDVNIAPGVLRRGYTFTLPGIRDNDGKLKQYLWCGTKMYSKLGYADLKLVDPDTKQIIATFERKGSFSSFVPPEMKGKKINNHQRKPVGCLHFFESNVPKDMNEITIILTGYCVFEAENKQNEGYYD